MSMLINELSKFTGISAHTIRFYEKSGLIKGKRNEEVKSNNYLHYDEETVQRLGAIQRAKAAGFTISEIGQLINCFLDVYTKAQKIEVLDNKLATLREKMNELKEMINFVDMCKLKILNN